MTLYAFARCILTVRPLEVRRDVVNRRLVRSPQGGEYCALSFPRSIFLTQGREQARTMQRDRAAGKMIRAMTNVEV